MGRWNRNEATERQRAERAEADNKGLVALADEEHRRAEAAEERIRELEQTCDTISALENQTRDRLATAEARLRELDETPSVALVASLRARVREVEQERDRHWNSCKSLESHLMEIRRRIGGGHQSEVLALPDDVGKLVEEVRELRAALEGLVESTKLTRSAVRADAFAEALMNAEALLARTETPKEEK